MTTFTIRPARESEADLIKELIHLTKLNPMGLDWKRFVTVVNDQDQVMGIGQLKPHGGDIVELASIAVFPAYRELGVARAIIEHLIQAAPRPLYLMCESKMGPFYEKFGFQGLEYPEMPRYFQRLAKLAGLAAALARHEEKLLVMKLQ